MTTQLQPQQLHSEQNASGYATFTITTMSMFPTLRPGFRVLAREIPPSEWPTITNKVVCVETNDGFDPMIMRLNENRLIETARLHLHTEPDRFGRTADIGVPVTDIERIWHITHITNGLVV